MVASPVIVNVTRKACSFYYRVMKKLLAIKRFFLIIQRAFSAPFKYFKVLTVNKILWSAIVKFRKRHRVSFVSSSGDGPKTHACTFKHTTAAESFSRIFWVGKTNRLDITLRYVAFYFWGVRICIWHMENLSLLLNYFGEKPGGFECKI